MASRRNVHYSPLPADEDDYDGIARRQYDARFDYTPKSFDKIPWKSIVLALFLLSLGLLLLFLSYFIFTGHMGGERSQAYGLLALGVLSFLPGFYETRVAYYAWRGINGYRFASIPDY
ncbi:uncharacterized protein LOC132183359 [Corylus avellana]|uniref:uncharacterized protein LOC132183359 n=1 Tax=Corylus avellana TaxID=13451 RepID=UPI001E21938D|nr:uncharacterized protein LOC132183359 [Corylus avellana]XP_059452770.1 uncharacterized protein LOC132183359 [Corylus avellana]XP_059452773.1 uncharacterized protein LOC132183359 [Corylus avellana]